MRLPWVSRELLAREREINAWLRTENARLIEQLLAMRRDGFAPKTAAIVHEPIDPETEGLRRAEEQRIAHRRAERDRAFIDRAAADIVAKTGVPRHQAEREAKRLLDESRAEQPAGG